MGAERMGANTCYACLCLVAIALSLPVEFHIGNEVGVHTVVPEVSFAAEPMPPPVSNIELGAISPALQKAEAEKEQAEKTAEKEVNKLTAQAESSKEELHSAGKLAKSIVDNAEAETESSKGALKSA